LRRSYDLYCRFEYKSPPGRSQLAADNRATGWIQLSHQVTAYMNLAADNVRALASMLIVADKLEVPLHAHYPVMRAALEGSAQAKWILESDSHVERVRRGLSARFSEERQDQRLYQAQRLAVVLHNPALEREMNRGDEQERTKHVAMLREIRRCAEALGVDWGTVCSGSPGMETMLRRVGGAGPVPGEYVASVWKVLSGLAHPSASRAVKHTHLEELRESSGGVVTVRVTASLQQTLQGLVATQGLFTDAVALYQRRLLTPHSASPVADVLPQR
jgi:hypothetical protein